MLQNSAAAQTISDNPSLFKIITPINIDCFQALLVTHPNQPLVSSVCRSLREGVWPFSCPNNSAPTTFDFSECPACEASLSFLREHHDIELDCKQYSPSFVSPASIHLSNLTICKILLLYFTMFTNITNKLLPGYSRMTYLENFIAFQFTLSGRLSKLSQ